MPVMLVFVIRTDRANGDQRMTALGLDRFQGERR
jgi:hypothetical protein